MIECTHNFFDRHWYDYSSSSGNCTRIRSQSIQSRPCLAWLHHGTRPQAHRLPHPPTKSKGPHICNHSCRLSHRSRAHRARCGLHRGQSGAAAAEMAAAAAVATGTVAAATVTAASGESGYPGGGERGSGKGGGGSGDGHGNAAAAPLRAEGWQTMVAAALKAVKAAAETLAATRGRRQQRRRRWRRRWQRRRWR